MERISGLEYLRVIAITAIVIDHYIGGYVGRYLGETYNCVFFCISAILFGLRWNLENKPKYNLVAFLKPRMKRLSVVYYPFIIFSILILIYLFPETSLSKIFMNLIYLSWFAKLPGLGHLWFLTMLIMCYVLFVLLSKIHNILNYLSWIFIGILCLIFHYYIQKNGLPGYVFFILLYCGVLFVCADKFMASIKYLKATQLIPIYIFINILAIFLYKNGLFDYSPFLSKYVGTICGFSNLVLFVNIFEKIKITQTISYLSAVSFEIYLVHNPIAYYKCALINIFSSQLLSFLEYIIITMICAYFLKGFSNIIHNGFRKIVNT